MPVTPPPLIGRAAVLAEVVRRARAGRGSALTGSRGLGGSRLLIEAFAALRRARIRVARLTLPPPGELPRVDPFLALLDRATAAQLPPGDRAALRAAIRRLQLQAVVIDDAHLLDGATGALVVELAREGVAVIANVTGPGGMPDALQPLADEDLLQPTPLDPLSPDEVVELAEQLLGDPVETELAQALLRASAGRPGTLAELIEDAVTMHAIVDGDGLWRLAGPLPPPRSVRTAVLGAFTLLPPDQRGWIAAVATAESVADDLARRIASPATISAADETGWTLRAEPGATRVRSSPLAAAVLGTLDDRARLAVVHRLARAARAVDRPLTERERIQLILWQAELGERTDGDEAFRLAMLPSTDDESREALLRVAVEAGAPAGAALAEHLRRTRRASEALALIRTALPDAGSDTERISLIRVAAMTIGVVERRSAEALEALDERIAEAGPHRDLLAVRAALLLLEARPREAVETAEVVLRSGDDGGFATSLALLQRALGLRELGQLERSVAAAHRFAAVAARESAMPQISVLARWAGAEVAVAVGAELDEAERALVDEYAAAPEEHGPAGRAPLAYTLASIRLHRGDPGAAVRLLREADAGSGSWREGWQPRILAELTVAHALTGALEEARATHERLLRIACPPIQHARVDLAAAQLAAAEGRRAEAAELAAETAEEGRRRSLVLDAFDAGFAAVRYGAPGAAERLLALGSAPGGAGREAQRAYAAALVTEDPQAVDAAAVGLWRAGLRLHAVEAAARAAELGAAESQPRLVAWLTRAPGLRLPGITDRGAAGLTQREREVAILAAGGASDRAIATELGITLRTAQTHLGRAFAKLGVHRRTDLHELVGEP
jgi:DNA-binding CsgD family transcriptional regulator